MNTLFKKELEKDLRNYVEYDKLYSDLVYPLDKGYYYTAELAERWVKLKLKGHGVTDIANKYTVDLGGLLVTNHDGIYYLTQK